MNMNFKQNLGAIDRAVRSIIGLALIGVSTALLPAWSWVTAVTGAFLLLEAAAAY